LPVGGKRVKVWRARPFDQPDAPCELGVITADGVLGAAAGSALVLEEVQPEGKRAMTATAWRAGLRVDARVDA